MLIGGNYLDTLHWIEKEKLIAIIRGYNTEEALEIAKSLYAGGITTLEIALNSQQPFHTIEKIRKEMGDAIKVGGGTVLDPESARLAISAGAQFILSPTVNIPTIKLTKRYGVVSIPGALTPTEILDAFEEGADIIKVFPISSLQSNYIKDLLGPLPQLKLLPTGGVTLENIKLFIQQGATGVGLGGSLVHQTNSVTNDYLSELTKKAKLFVQEANTID